MKILQIIEWLLHGLFVADEDVIWYKQIGNANDAGIVRQR